METDYPTASTSRTHGKKIRRSPRDVAPQGRSRSRRSGMQPPYPPVQKVADRDQAIFTSYSGSPCGPIEATISCPLLAFDRFVILYVSNHTPLQLALLLSFFTLAAVYSQWRRLPSRTKITNAMLHSTKSCMANPRESAAEYDQCSRKIPRLKRLQ